MIKRLKPFCFPLIVGLIFALLLLFITFPKFLLIDKILSQKGIYMTAKSVQEKLFSIELKNVSFYDRNSKLMDFEKINISIIPFSIKLTGKSSSGFVEINYYYLKKQYNIKARQLKTLNLFTIQDADIDLGKDIKGNLTIKNLNSAGLKLETIILNFKGRTFNIKLQDRGIESSGSGIITIAKDIIDSQLNAEVLYGGYRIIFSGTLQNLKISPKSAL